MTNIIATEQIVFAITVSIEVAAALIILLGVLKATYGYLRYNLFNSNTYRGIDNIRIALGSSIGMGVGLLLSANLLKLLVEANAALYWAIGLELAVGGAMTMLIFAADKYKTRDTSPRRNKKDPSDIKKKPNRPNYKPKAQA